MAIRYLKSGKPQIERSEDDAKVRAVVEDALADIEARGDAAIRDLAKKFDNYTPESYRLSQQEIDALIAEVSARDMEDIRFAQAQVRKFAEIQRAGLAIGEAVDHKPTAANIAGLLIHHGESKINRHSRIKRIAARGQHITTHLRGNAVGTDHHGFVAKHTLRGEPPVMAIMLALQVQKRARQHDDAHHDNR